MSNSVYQFAEGEVIDLTKFAKKNNKSKKTPDEKTKSTNKKTSKNNTTIKKETLSDSEAYLNMSKNAKKKKEEKIISFKEENCFWQTYVNIEDIDTDIEDTNYGDNKYILHLHKSLHDKIEDVKIKNILKNKLVNTYFIDKSAIAFDYAIVSEDNLNNIIEWASKNSGEKINRKKG